MLLFQFHHKWVIVQQSLHFYLSCFEFIVNYGRTGDDPCIFASWTAYMDSSPITYTPWVWLYDWPYAWKIWNYPSSWLIIVGLILAMMFTSPTILSVKLWNVPLFVELKKVKLCVWVVMSFQSPRRLDFKKEEVVNYQFHATKQVIFLNFSFLFAAVWLL